MKIALSRIVRTILNISTVVLVSLVALAGITDVAITMDSSNSHPTDGTAQMNELQQESRQAVNAEPRKPDQVKEKAQSGPNAVQGDKDLHGMNVPDNSESARTVRKQIEGALDKVAPGN
jgi:hypothetical protein